MINEASKLSDNRWNGEKCWEFSSHFQRGKRITSRSLQKPVKLQIYRCLH